MLSVLGFNAYTQIDTLNSYPVDLIIEKDSINTDVFHIQLFDSTLSTFDIGNNTLFGRGIFRFSIFKDSTRMEYLSYPVSGYVTADPRRTNLFSQAIIEFELTGLQVNLLLDLTNQLGEKYKYVLSGEMIDVNNNRLTNFNPSSCNEIMRCRWNRTYKLKVCVQNGQLIVKEDSYVFIKPKSE